MAIFIIRKFKEGKKMLDWWQWFRIEDTGGGNGSSSCDSSDDSKDTGNNSRESDNSDTNKP